VGSAAKARSRRVLLTSRRPAAALLASAGVAAAAGSLLDWSGVSYSSSVDRWLAGVSGGALLALALAVRARGAVLAAGAIVPAAVVLNMAVVNFRDIHGHRFEYAGYADARVGIGIYLLFAAAALGLAAAVLGALAWRRGRATMSAP
jgi:hypothetical protein